MRGNVPSSFRLKTACPRDEPRGFPVWDDTRRDRWRPIGGQLRRFGWRLIHKPPTFSRRFTSARWHIQHQDAMRMSRRGLGPERIHLGLLGVGRPDLLYSTPDHASYLAARRVQRPAVVPTRCTLDAYDILLTGRCPRAPYGTCRATTAPGVQETHLGSPASPPGLRRRRCHPAHARPHHGRSTVPTPACHSPPARHMHAERCRHLTPEPQTCRLQLIPATGSYATTNEHH